MSETEQHKVDFNGLVAGLAASAVTILAQVEALLSGAELEEGESLGPEQRRERASQGLSGARQLIDTLAVLQEKTAGNLTGEEKELLDSALSELRIRFVEMAGRSESTEGGKEGDAG